MRRITTLFAAIAWCIACGCSDPPMIRTATDLAAALRAEGIGITAQEPAPMPTGQHFRFDQGIRVSGDNLSADILRIEDRTVFDIARSAGRLLIATEAVAGQPLPEAPDVFARYPFVVVIRREPVRGSIEDALAKLLPPERE